MKRIFNPTSLRIIAAVILLICLVLPLRSCSQYVDKDGNPIQRDYTQKVDKDGVTTYVQDPLSPDAELKTDYDFIWDIIRLNDPWSFNILICFLWPFPFILYRYKGTHNRIKLLLWLIEPIFIVYCFLFLLFTVTFLSNPSFGAFLAFAAYGIYGAVWLVEAVIKIINMIRRLST